MVASAVAAAAAALIQQKGRQEAEAGRERVCVVWAAVDTDSVGRWRNREGGRE